VKGDTTAAATATAAEVARRAAMARGRGRAGQAGHAPIALCTLAAAIATGPRVAGAPPPVETLAVQASRAGFRPSVLELRAGERYRIGLTTADVEHCFAVDAFRVEKRILPGKTTWLLLTPGRSGTFPFYSCLEPENDVLRGRLVVRD
jgi:heme/copper-type cytochrome/quinol oxidase subunit 2